MTHPKAVVAAGSKVVDSLGREWDPIKHPRGKDGKFIRVFKLIKMFLGDGQPWATGRVEQINDSGSIKTKITKVAPEWEGTHGHYVGKYVDVLPGDVESLNEKATLNLDTPADKLGKYDFTPEGMSDFFKKAGMTTDGPSSDVAKAALAAKSFKNGQLHTMTGRQKYHLALYAFNQSGDGKPHTDGEFAQLLEEFDVDPDVIDDTPDGLSGLKKLLDDENFTRSPNNNESSIENWVEQIPVDDNVIRQAQYKNGDTKLVWYADGSRAIVGKDGSHEEVDPNMSTDDFVATGYAREHNEVKADLTPKPAPGPTDKSAPLNIDFYHQEQVPQELALLDREDIPDYGEEWSVDGDNHNEVYLVEDDNGEKWFAKYSTVQTGGMGDIETDASISAVASRLFKEAPSTGTNDNGDVFFSKQIDGYEMETPKDVKLNQLADKQELLDLFVMDAASTQEDRKEGNLFLVTTPDGVRLAPYDNEAAGFNGLDYFVEEQDVIYKDLLKSYFEDTDQVTAGAELKNAAQRVKAAANDVGADEFNSPLDKIINDPDTWEAEFRSKFAPGSENKGLDDKATAPKPDVIANTTPKEKPPVIDNSAKKFEILDDPGKSGDGYFQGAVGGLWGKYGAAGVLVRHKDENGVERFLMVQRGPIVHSNKGKWQLPGGALNSNENDYQGTARELYEELQSPDGWLDNLKPVGEVKFETGGGWHYTNIAADAPEMFEPTVDGTETGDAKWFTKEEIANLPLHPALAKNLDEIFGKYDNPDEVDDGEGPAGPGNNGGVGEPGVPDVVDGGPDNGNATNDLILPLKKNFAKEDGAADSWVNAYHSWQTKIYKHNIQTLNNTPITKQDLNGEETSTLHNYYINGVGILTGYDPKTDTKKALAGYYAINSAHRTGWINADDPDAKIVRKHSKNLDAAIAKSTLEQDTKVYRALTFRPGSKEDYEKTLASLVPGAVVTDKGFVSTTISPEYAHGFSELAGTKTGSKHIVFEVDLPAGTHALIGAKHEGELILPRDTPIAITTTEEMDDEYGKYVLVKATLSNNNVDNPLIDGSNQPDPEEVYPAQVKQTGTPLDATKWTSVGPQMGSNAGGLFEDENGNKFYVKAPKSETHAKNEVLASQLYAAAGINSDETRLAYTPFDGKLGTASPWMENSKKNLSSKMHEPEYRDKLREGFVVDAWLANWDVAGLSYDNILTDENGDPVRIDAGGALFFRAQGTPKGALFSDTVGELTSLKSDNHNPSAFFKGITHEQEIDSAKRVLSVTPGMIDDLVDEIDFSDTTLDPDTVKTRLKARREYIADYYGLGLPEAENMDTPALPHEDVPEADVTDQMVAGLDSPEVSDEVAKLDSWFTEYLKTFDDDIQEALDDLELGKASSLMDQIHEYMSDVTDGEQEPNYGKLKKLLGELVDEFNTETDTHSAKKFLAQLDKKGAELEKKLDGIYVDTHGDNIDTGNYELTLTDYEINKLDVDESVEDFIDEHNLTLEESAAEDGGAWWAVSGSKEDLKAFWDDISSNNFPESSLKKADGTDSNASPAATAESDAKNNEEKLVYQAQSIENARKALDEVEAANPDVPWDDLETSRSISYQVAILASSGAFINAPDDKLHEVTLKYPMGHEKFPTKYKATLTTKQAKAIGRASNHFAAIHGNTSGSIDQAGAILYNMKHDKDFKVLDVEQFKAVREYIKPKTEINKKIRSGTVDTETQHQIDVLENLIDQSTVHKMTVYRGMHNDSNSQEFNDFVSKLEVGNVIEEKGFLSTSKDSHQAGTFMAGIHFNPANGDTPESGIMFEIDVPEGAHGLDIDNTTHAVGEGEILFKTNSKLEITNKYYDDKGNLIVSAKLVPEDSPADSGAPDAVIPDSADDGVSVDAPDGAYLPLQGGEYVKANGTWHKKTAAGKYVPMNDVASYNFEQMWKSKNQQGDAETVDVPDLSEDAPALNLPGPYSTDWKNMVDEQGPYRWGHGEKKLRIGDTVESINDGFSGEIVKFESNHKGIIVKGPDGKKKARKNDTLKLVSSSVPETPEPDTTPEPDVPQTDTPDVPQTDTPDVVQEVKDVFDSEDWDTLVSLDSSGLYYDDNPLSTALEDVEHNFNIGADDKKQTISMLEEIRDSIASGMSDVYMGDQYMEAHAKLDKIIKKLKGEDGTRTDAPNVADVDVKAALDDATGSLWSTTYSDWGDLYVDGEFGVDITLQDVMDDLYSQYHDGAITKDDIVNELQDASVKLGENGYSTASDVVYQLSSNIEQSDLPNTWNSPVAPAQTEPLSPLEHKLLKGYPESVDPNHEADFANAVNAFVNSDKKAIGDKLKLGDNWSLSYEKDNHNDSIIVLRDSDNAIHGAWDKPSFPAVHMDAWKIIHKDDAAGPDNGSNIPSSAKHHVNDLATYRADIPKKISEVKQKYPGFTDFQAKQFRNAGFAMDDALKQEPNSDEWNASILKAMYNLKQAGDPAKPTLDKLNEWHNAVTNPVSESNNDHTPSADAPDLGPGFPNPPVGSVPMYETESGLYKYLKHPDGQMWVYTQSGHAMPSVNSQELDGLPGIKKIGPDASTIDLGPNFAKVPPGHKVLYVFDENGVQGTVYAVKSTDGNIYYYYNDGSVAVLGSADQYVPILEKPTNAWKPYKKSNEDTLDLGPGYKNPPAGSRIVYTGKTSIGGNEKLVAVKHPDGVIYVYNNKNKSWKAAGQNDWPEQYWDKVDDTSASAPTQQLPSNYKPLPDGATITHVYDPGTNDKVYAVQHADGVYKFYYPDGSTYGSAVSGDGLDASGLWDKYDSSVDSSADKMLPDAFQQPPVGSKLIAKSTNDAVYAVEHPDGTKMWYYNDGGTLKTDVSHAAFAESSNWEILDPDWNKPSAPPAPQKTGPNKPGADGKAIYIGDKVKSTTDSLEGTVVGFESGGKPGVKVLGSDGKVRMRHHKKLKSLESDAAPASPQAPTPAPQPIVVKKKPKPTLRPDKNSPWYRKPKPEPPTPEESGQEPWVLNADEWIKEAEDIYNNTPNTGSTNLQASSITWGRVQAVVNNGDMEALDKLLDRKRISQKMYDDAKKQILKVQKVNDEAKAKHAEKMKEYVKQVSEWKLANGIDDSVFPGAPKLSNEDFTGGPADWDKALLGTPTANSAFDALKNGDADIAIRGVSIATDSDQIEDLDVRMLRVIDANGNEKLEAKFKLTAWAGDELVSKISSKPGIMVENGVYLENRSIDNKTGLPKYKSSHKWSSSGKTYTYTDPDTGAQVRVSRGEGSATKQNGQTSIHNQVRIFMSPDATPEDYQKTLENLGIKQATPATRNDLKTYAENRLMMLVGKTNALHNEDNPSMRDTLLKQVKSKYGIGVEDLRVDVSHHGRIKLVLSDDARDKVIQITNMEGITHSVNGGSDADKFMSILTGPNAGLHPTAVRWSEGLGGSGMSSGPDMNSGSSDNLFTRIIHHGAKTASHGPKIVIHPLAAAKRVDLYVNDDDNGTGKHYDGVYSYERMKGNPYEIQYKHGFTVSDMWYVSMGSSHERDALIQKLQAAGIDEINGIPVDQFVLIAGMDAPQIDEALHSSENLPPVV